MEKKGFVVVADELESMRDQEMEMSFVVVAGGSVLMHRQEMQEVASVACLVKCRHLGR